MHDGGWGADCFLQEQGLTSPPVRGHEDGSRKLRAKTETSLVWLLPCRVEEPSGVTQRVRGVS